MPLDFPVSWKETMKRESGFCLHVCLCVSRIEVVFDLKLMEPAHYDRKSRC